MASDIRVEVRVIVGSECVAEGSNSGYAHAHSAHDLLRGALADALASSDWWERWKHAQRVAHSLGLKLDSSYVPDLLPADKRVPDQRSTS